MANSVIISPITNGVQILLSGTSSVNTALQNFDWNTGLQSGANSQWISYPVNLSSIPTTIVPFFQNSIDNYSYFYSVSGVTQSGFYINFSDYLKASGYNLYINMFV